MAARARWAITAVFAVNGSLIATMAARTPSLKVDLGLSPGQLGLVTAAFGVAAVGAMQGAGALAGRFGSRWVVRSAVTALPIALVGTALARELLSLLAVHLLFGAVHGLLDVTMNAHAVAVERALGRSILNGCHAAWSIGAVGGSLVASGAAQFGLSRAVHYGVLAVVLVPVAAAWTNRLLPAATDRGSVVRAERARWSRPLVVLGAMGATVLTVEAAVANWSGIFLHERLTAPLGVAALGYVAFTACQTAGRLVGDRLLARRTAHELLRVGTLTAAGGLVVVVASPWPAVAIAGFALIGIGLATPLPVLFGAAGHLGAATTGAAGTVARFSTMTYTGILLAPPVIGAVAGLIGLTWTLAALAPLLASVAVVNLRGLTEAAPTGSPAEPVRA
ncbi:fucose permease [Asanoa ferruginea]|uniref:Fucose permease n=1 Tax=Asanoa ferruginea TaxID=53367 RepID=A0A3D9ZWQ5_9ACTN|nr:MFS transporter [Asanoa ferruginea]REG01592.1 fucose permease [Asanoa ferruginea]GIF53890.1 MFS transporter [Asanoa ferruginea]